MKILITGGGTAGHINPGLAIAKYFCDKDSSTEVKFAGTKNGIESKLVPKSGYNLYTFDIEGLSREKNFNGLKKNIKAIKKALSSANYAKKILKEFKPDLVIGCGGYASFPVVYAAQKQGLPTALLEVNALPGVTTKVLARKANKVFTCFEDTKKLLPVQNNVIMTGAPVRSEMIFSSKDEARKKLNIPAEEKLVVSFWGSLGALYMNRHMVDYFEEYSKENRFYHIHAMGQNAMKWMPDEMHKRGINFENNEKLDLREYIYDMDVVMAAADLIVCRAGAATTFELCLMGKPSIMVPSPYVAENHQEKNARALEKKGACIVITEVECNGKMLYNKILELLEEQDKLTEMSKNAKMLAFPNSTKEIYEHLMTLI